MRSAILLAFVALYGCATAPGYRSSSVRPPEAFREDPHPLSPAPVGRGGTKDEPPVSSDYWDQLSDTTLSRLVGEVLRGILDVRSARARVSAARSDRIRRVLDLTTSPALAAGSSRQRLLTVGFLGSYGACRSYDV